MKLPTLQEIEVQIASLGRPTPKFSRADHARSRREIAEWERQHPKEAAEYRRLCDQRAAVVEQQEEQIRRENLLRSLEAAGCGARSLGHALTPGRETPALMRARKWMSNADSWALVLCGGVGTGKTTAAYWTMAEAMRKGSTVATRHAAQLGKSPSYAEALRELARLKKVGLLVLDDVGAQAMSSHGEGLLWELLDARYEARRRTVLTTNVAGPKLSERLGERAVDRLRDGGVIYDMTGASMRGAQ